MTTTSRKALIVGCGIAGPITAMFLRQAGFASVVYEGRPEPRDEAGFFLNIAPNGLAVLGALGLRDRVLEQGIPTTSLAFLNHRGKQIGTNPQATTLIKRGALVKILREAAIERGIPIEFGKRLTGIRVTPQGQACARFEDETEATGDFLVGCDGINSRTRRIIMPEAPSPRYLGIIDVGGFTRNSAALPPDGVMRMTFGLHGFFGYQATPGGEIFWFANMAQADEPGPEQFASGSNSALRQKLIEVHRYDHYPIAEIIRSTKTGIGAYPNYEMPPMPAWHKGPVCLIGDAAHAMSPAAGQGASMAMEDAMALARCLRDIPDVDRAFASFERLRRSRVEQVASAARRSSGQKGPPGPLGRWARDLMLPLFLRMTVGGARKVYSYRLEWSDRAAL